MKPEPAPHAPRHLKAGTRRWWQSVVADWALEQHHIRLLTLAGRWNLTTTIQRPAGGVVVPMALDVPPPAPS